MALWLAVRCTDTTDRWECMCRVFFFFSLCVPLSFSLSLELAYSHCLARSISLSCLLDISCSSFILFLFRLSHLSRPTQLASE